MVYMAVLSATLAIRRRAHIRMTTFDNKLPRRLIICLDLLADIAVMILGAILLVEGIKFCNSPLAANGKYASLPNLSKVWQYLPIPVAGGSMIIFELEQVFLHIEEFFIPNSEEAKQA
jgi:TRAP-type C4-dicarboxylate transport system permease small subunit